MKRAQLRPSAYSATPRLRGNRSTPLLAQSLPISLVEAVAEAVVKTAASVALDRPAPLAPLAAEEAEAGPDEILSAPDRFARCEGALELHEAQAKNVAGAHFALARFALARE